MGLEDWAEEANEEAESEGRLFATDDDSFREEFIELVNELPAKHKKELDKLSTFNWEVGGCGRHFTKNMKFDIVFDQKLIDLINKYEEE